MRIAAFCFFAPAAFSLGLRRWLLGKESTGEALLHFGTAALWLNALALALLDARFHVEVPVVQALSQSGLFALKYLALTCALALAGCWPSACWPGRRRRFGCRSGWPHGLAVGGAAGGGAVWVALCPHF